MKKVKQINNLVIKEYSLTDMRNNLFNRDSLDFRYSVFMKDGRMLDDRLTLEQAERFCTENKFLESV